MAHQLQLHRALHVDDLQLERIMGTQWVQTETSDHKFFDQFLFEFIAIFFPFKNWRYSAHFQGGAGLFASWRGGQSARPAKSPLGTNGAPYLQPTAEHIRSAATRCATRSNQRNIKGLILANFLLFGQTFI